MRKTATHVLTAPPPRVLLWLLLAAPFAWLVAGWYSGALVYGELLHASGKWSAQLLMLTMAITPLRLMFPRARLPAWLLRHRRHLGVGSFAYAFLHTVVYIEDKANWSLIKTEATSFSMWTGWVAIFLMLLLAATSTDASVRALKRSWKKLHRLVYPAAALVFAHWIFSAFDFVQGLIHFAILAGLEAYRLWKRGRQLANAT